MARRDSNLRFQSAGGARSAGVPVGKKQRLRIERLSHDGRGIAFFEGRTWFVSGALAGEEVEARVLVARSKIVEAKLERLLAAADARQAMPCASAGVCGGCTLQHLRHADQLSLKQDALADQLQRVAGVRPKTWAPPLQSPAFGYRRRARIAVRWDARAGRLAVGFREASSQSIVELADCQVLVPSLQPIARALPSLLNAFERPRAIGHVELFHGSASALLLRHLEPLHLNDLARLQAFCETVQAQLWLQGAGAAEPHLPNSGLGYHLPPWDLTLAYRPGDFVQVNDEVNQAMIRQAIDWLDPNPSDRVLDLFCGLGNFALPLARTVREVVGIEGEAGMVERAQRNARENGLANAHFIQADLSKPLAGLADPHFDLVVLDPPREGAAAVVERLPETATRRVLYVSCNPATLARDTAMLVGQGYRLVRAGVLDMFPQTAHVEAMALFEAPGTR